MDVKSFMELLIDNLAGIVQYNGLQTQDIFSVLVTFTITLMSDHRDPGVRDPHRRDAGFPLGEVGRREHDDARRERGGVPRPHLRDLHRSGGEEAMRTFSNLLCSSKTSTAVEVSAGDLGSGRPALSSDGTRWS